MARSSTGGRRTFYRSNDQMAKENTATSKKATSKKGNSGDDGSKDLRKLLEDQMADIHYAEKSRKRH